MSEAEKLEAKVAEDVREWRRKKAVGVTTHPRHSHDAIRRDAFELSVDGPAYLDGLKEHEVPVTGAHFQQLEALLGFEGTVEGEVKLGGVRLDTLTEQAIKALRESEHDLQVAITTARNEGASPANLILRTTSEDNPWGLLTERERLVVRLHAVAKRTPHVARRLKRLLSPVEQALARAREMLLLAETEEALRVEAEADTTAVGALMLGVLNYVAGWADAVPWGTPKPPRPFRLPAISAERRAWENRRGKAAAPPKRGKKAKVSTTEPAESPMHAATMAPPPPDVPATPLDPSPAAPESIPAPPARPIKAQAKKAASRQKRVLARQDR
ncbi:MAG: hypothetical protein AB2A00_23985 [Myxococcota bacterium]